MAVSITRNAGKAKRYPAIDNFPRVLVTGNECKGNRNYYVIRDFIRSKYLILITYLPKPAHNFSYNCRSPGYLDNDYLEP